MQDGAKLALAVIVFGMLYLFRHPDVAHTMFLWMVGIASCATVIYILVLINRHNKAKEQRAENERIRADQDRQRQEELRDWESRQLHEDMNIAVNESIEEIERIPSSYEKGIAFEQRMAAHFRLEGADVQTTPRTGDGSADLILSYPDGKREVIQCKCWQNSVSPTVVAEVLKAKQLRKADRAVIITTSHLTKQAKQEANELGIEYWERARLLREIDQMRSRVLANKATAARPMSVNIRAVE